MVLNVAALGTAFTKDPSIALRDFIKTNYTLQTPAKDTINFDTKFSRYDKYNHIIVENIAKPINVKTLGASRYRHQDVKRIQLFFSRNSSKNDLFLVEEHIEEIINDNPRGMITDGIEEATITEFRPIFTRSEDMINKQQVDSTNISRSFALCTLKYDKVRA